jgi:hypothetical protein
MGGVRTTCHLELAMTEAGGLPQPLALPTRSLVFMLIDGPEAGSRLVALIERTDPPVDALTAGLTADALVTFLARPGIDVSKGRRYSLWMGSVFGEAVLTEILD